MELDLEYLAWSEGSNAGSHHFLVYKVHANEEQYRGRRWDQVQTDDSPQLMYHRLKPAVDVELCLVVCLSFECFHMLGEERRQDHLTRRHVDYDHSVKHTAIHGAEVEISAAHDATDSFRDSSHLLPVPARAIPL